MQLLCKNGVVLEFYGDDAQIPPGRVGDGVVVINYAGAMEDLGRVGDPPPPGSGSDIRSYKAPALDLAAYAAAKRYAVETGGITVNGAVIATDRASQALISGAFNLVTVDPSISVKFKTEGGFATLDAAAVTAIATAVGKHVQACFAKEADVAAGIASGSVKTTAKIDTAFAALT